MAIVNSLDIQNLLGDLEKDVIEACAAERSAWEYDEYLANGEDLDEQTVAEHEGRLIKLHHLLQLLQWYRNDTLVQFRRPAPRTKESE